jgi:hypothetical protein
MESIYFADALYWHQTEPPLAAKAEYYRRQSRLKEIRREVCELGK